MVVAFVVFVVVLVVVLVAVSDAISDGEENLGILKDGKKERMEGGKGPEWKVYLSMFHKIPSRLSTFYP